jgi:DNA-3-methyladenine glycosylase II
VHATFDKNNFHALCNKLCRRDEQLSSIVAAHGFPPLWSRSASFETLIHIILEQQVSLASARAALNKLKEKLGSITAKKLLALSDEELRDCYFSRQKTVYAKCLANAIVDKEIELKNLTTLDEPELRRRLKTIKGIGDWTVDVYLLFCLHRTDVFPLGDLAMVNALKEIKQLPGSAKPKKLLAVAEPWRPYRSIATMLLWHYYIQKRGIKI